MIVKCEKNSKLSKVICHTIEWFRRTISETITFLSVMDGIIYIGEIKRPYQNEQRNFRPDRNSTNYYS